VSVDEQSYNQTAIIERIQNLTKMRAVNQKNHMLSRKLKSSTFVSLIAILASFNVVCDSLVGFQFFSAGVWYSWIFISEPVTGIILGPLAGFFSSFIGVMVGHFVYFRGAEEFLFTLGAPIGTMMSAFVFRGQWRLVLLYYLALIGVFFATPISWQLPFWGMWDVYLGLGLIFVAACLGRYRRKLWNLKSSTGVLLVGGMSAFIGLEADVLFRIFIFVPCQTYQLFYGYDAGALKGIWALGAVETPVKVMLSTIVTIAVWMPIFMSVRKLNLVTQNQLNEA
jgi:hypothetical protein